MELEDQVTNLELSKALKKAEVKQESLWYWIIPFAKKATPWIGGHHFKHCEEEKYSAFTVAELGEMLPTCYYSGKQPNGKWNCFDYIGGSESLKEGTEANARVKMVLNLIEKGIIKV